MNVSPFKWESKHVKGHEDDTVPSADLDIWARSNIQADTMAKQYWTWVQDEEPIEWPNERYKNKGWSMYYNRMPIESKIGENIHMWTSEKPMKEYWIQKGRTTDTGYYKSGGY